VSVLKKFAGQTLIYGLTTVVSRLLNFVLTPILVHKYPTAVYGVFTNLYSWAAMVNALLAFGMETTFFRYLQKVEEKDQEKVFNNSFLITLFTAALFVFTVFFNVDAIASWLNNGVFNADYKTYVQFFTIILAADALAVVPFAKLRAEGKPLRYGLLKLVNIITFVCFTLLFILLIPALLRQPSSFANSVSSWFEDGWLGYVFLANLIASVVTLVMLAPQIISFQWKLDKKLMWSMLSYSLPILIANISFIINEYLDKMLLPKLLPDGQGEHDLGIYGAVSKIAVFLSIFIQGFRLGAEPFFFAYAKNANARQTYALIMQYFVMAMMVVMVGLSVNIEWLKYFIKGATIEARDEYWSGLFILPLILFNYVLLGIYINLSVWYKLTDQTRYGLYISGIGAIITFVLCYVLIPQYSYVGAVIVTSITYLVMLCLSYYWGQRYYAIPYKVGKMLLYMVIGGLLVYIDYHWFARNLWVGNAFLCAYLVLILFLEKDQFMKILHRK